MNKAIVNTGKVIVVIIAIAIMIKSIDYSTLFHESIYFDNCRSYTSDEVIQIYGLRDNNTGAHLQITSLDGNIISEENIQFETDYTKEIKPQTGYPKIKLKDLDLRNYKPGIYIINDQNYFVVKGKEKTKVTFIVPTLSTICIDTTGGYSLLTENKKTECATISTLKPLKIDDYSLQLNNLIQILPDNISINYCTDLDFQKTETIPESDVYVLYGNCHYSTPQMLLKLNNMIRKGKNIILISSYSFNNKVFYSKNQISTCIRDNENHKLMSYNLSDSLINFDVFGANYTYGGKPISKDFPYLNQNTKLELNSPPDHLPLFAEYWIGPKDTNSVNFLYKIQTSYHNTKNIGGIFTFQSKPSSGIIFHLGTKEWLEKVNLEINNNRELISFIFKQAAEKI